MSKYRSSLPERGYRFVRATDEEVAEYNRKRGYAGAPAVDRVECIATGKRLWASGMGIGSHERACKASHWRSGN